MATTGKKQQQQELPAKYAEIVGQCYVVKWSGKYYPCRVVDPLDTSHLAPNEQVQAVKKTFRGQKKLEVLVSWFEKNNQGLLLYSRVEFNKLSSIPPTKKASDALDKGLYPRLQQMQIELDVEIFVETMVPSTCTDLFGRDAKSPVGAGDDGELQSCTITNPTDKSVPRDILQQWLTEFKNAMSDNDSSLLPFVVQWEEDETYSVVVKSNLTLEDEGDLMILDHIPEEQDKKIKAHSTEKDESAHKKRKVTTSNKKRKVTTSNQVKLSNKPAEIYHEKTTNSTRRYCILSRIPLNEDKLVMAIRRFLRQFKDVLTPESRESLTQLVYNDIMSMYSDDDSSSTEDSAAKLLSQVICNSRFPCRQHHTNFQALLLNDVERKSFVAEHLLGSSPAE